MARPVSSSAAELEGGLDVRPQFSREGETVDIPRRRIAEESVNPETAYHIIHDEMMLDGNARLNVATFGTTWMEPEAERLMAEAADKNMVDKDEYPMTAELEERCLDIIADFWHAPYPDTPIGCSTIGSSEACMLGGLALKWHWKDRQRAAGKDTSRPNLVLGSNVQVCWLKFCRYFEVEPNIVNLRPGETTLNPHDAAAACDENTIGVVAILGSTFDGAYEDVKTIAHELDRLQDEKGLNMPIHVDAASGGLFAPFVDPGLEWDFRLERVKSINASGHKYGLVYPGVGWLLFRDADARPDDLEFRVDYLGGDSPTMSLNFTKPGSSVVAQYYQFLRLGKQGYKRVHQHSRDIAMMMADRIGQMPAFELISDGSDLPVVCFCMNGDNTKSGKQRKGSYAAKASFDVHDVTAALRADGWQVPSYPFADGREDLQVIRVVVRNAFSRDLAMMFIKSLEEAVKLCEGQQERYTRKSFHH